MKRFLKKIFWTLIFLSIACAGGWYVYRYLQHQSVDSALKSEKAIEEQIVEVTKVALEPHAKMINVFGIIKLESIVINSREPVKIKYIVPKQTERVNKGDVLVEFEHQDKLLKLQKLQHEYTLAKNELGRQRQLYNNQGATSKAEYEKAVAKEGSTFSEIQIVQNEINNSIITAQFDCYIKHTDFIDGSFVQHNQEILTIFKTHPIGCEGKINIEHIKYVKKDNKCAVKINDYVVAEGKIISINRSIESFTASVIIRAEVENTSDEDIFSGELCNICINTGIQEYFVILPENAVKSFGPKYKVFVVKDGFAFTQDVELCGGLPNGMVKVSGLNTGDVVVISGIERLTNFCKVHVA